ncbi:GNAT family N-acetyltransferase [Hymenobacter cavernae]|uniref:Acetyltransferase n=1 Tax=Hymenobacter cavernae TaxID=2044852 RepID=A0ABQ1TYL0_9BACT|nr:GNAT family N-acetyltransferase [Hymenobacter cavernae]GGF06952.1 acetyltransferase [Hymenobacter cavernae]
MSITIRKAQPNDSARLAEIFLQSRRSGFFWLDPERFQLDDFERQTQGEVVWVAEKDSELAGFISVDEADAFIHHLFVAPGYQRLGIGRHLLRSLREWLPTPYTLKCLAKNKKARAFYKKNNWRIVGEGRSGTGAYLVLEFGRAATQQNTR